MLTSSGVTAREMMAFAVFGLGLTAIAGGLWTMLAREYQQTLRRIAAQSDRLHARALSEVGVVPVVDSATRLVEAVNQMVRTAMGVGAFLCLIGLALCLVAGWLLGI